MVLSRWQRFGYACVNFGPYVSVSEFSRLNDINFSKIDRNNRFAYVEKLCEQLMDSIERHVPILPVSLVAAVLLEAAGNRLSAFEIEANVNQLIDELEARGATVYVSRRSRAQNILTALNTLKLRRMVIESDRLFKTDPESHDLLSYYANSIAHWRL